MQISIKNVINDGTNEQIIQEVFEGFYKKISEKEYLSYRTDNNEKVVIKFDNTELIMTRYSQKLHKMRFTLYENTTFYYLGLQNLEVSTDTYKVENNKIIIIYTILQNQNFVTNNHLEITYDD